MFGSWSRVNYVFIKFAFAGGLTFVKKKKSFIKIAKI